VQEGVDMLIPHIDFPVRPSIEKGESLAGYICRFHGANGHRVPHALNEGLSALYAGTQEKATTTFDIVQSLVGDSVAFDPTWWLDGTIIERRSGGRQRAWRKLNYDPVRFCPACLSEYGFHFALWDLPLVQACSLHKCALLTECTLCQKTLSWATISPGWSCRCGKSIATMPAGPATKIAVSIAQFLAGSGDVEQPDSFQERLGEPTYGGYCLSDVYAGLEWVGELRDIFLNRDTRFGEPLYRRRRLTRWSWPSNWDVKLVADSPEQVVHRLSRVLIKQFRADKFKLYFVPESDRLNQAILFTNGADSNVFQNKIRMAVEHILTEYSVKLPISSVVLYSPRVSSERRIVYLTEFMTWWGALSKRIGELDPDMQSNQQITSSQLKLLCMQAREMEIEEVLNLLLDAALQRVAVENFRALSYWWRIPRELQELGDPNEVLSRIGLHLAVVSTFELAFVHDLIRQGRLGEQ